MFLLKLLLLLFVTTNLLQRSFTVDDRVAWAVITIPPAVLNAGETVDEWYTLSGRLGDGMEGRVNIVMSLTVSDASLSFSTFGMFSGC